MAVTGQPLINGVAYTHADIKLNMLGAPFVEITEINYAEPQEMTLNHGTGHMPTSRGHGNVTPSGSITIAKKEYLRLVQAAPNKKIQNIPDFPISVGYLLESGEFTRDVLRRCRFMGPDLTSSQNNSNVYVTLALSIAAIDWDAD